MDKAGGYGPALRFKRSQISRNDLGHVRRLECFQLIVGSIDSHFLIKQALHLLGPKRFPRGIPGIVNGNVGQMSGNRKAELSGG